MKTFPLLTGSVLAALAVSLTLVSCGDKDAESSDPPERKSSPKANPLDSGTDGREKATPPVDLENEVIGYWAPDTERIIREMEEKMKDEPQALAMTRALMAPMLSSMAVEIPEKGKFFIHMMGQKQEATYIVKSVDLSSNSFNVETTTEGEDGEMELESGTFTINGETLALTGGKEDGPLDSLFLIRIDEAAFKKRQDAKIPDSILDLPEGPDPEEDDVIDPAPGD